MTKAIDLKNGGIKENIDEHNKRLIKAYKRVVIIFIGFLGMILYINYLSNPDFYIRATILEGILLLPLIVFVLITIIKNNKYLNDFEKNPIYIRLKKRYGFNKFSDFENFDRKVTDETINNILFNDEKSQIMATNSYIIKYALPANRHFDVYDASKLLLVVFNPIKISKMLLSSRYSSYRNSMNQLILYFEDEMITINPSSKKKGEELSNKIAKVYKVLNSTNTELENFFNADRSKFIETCREQIKRVYAQDETH